MNYYDWPKIVSGYNDNELKRILREQSKEPKEKVEASRQELIKRGLLDAEKNVFIPKSDEHLVKNLEDVWGRTRSNSNNAKLAKSGIIMVMAVSAAMMLISIFMGGSGLTNARNNILILLVLSSLSLLATLFSIVAFLVWFYNIYDNLGRRFKVTDSTKGWAIGAWFVPILNLFKPYNMMDEVNSKTNLILKVRKIETAEEKSSWIGLWWATLIVAGVLSGVNSNLNNGGLQNLASAPFSGFMSFLYFFDIVKGVFAIMMINNFNAKEELLFESETALVNSQTKVMQE